MCVEGAGRPFDYLTFFYFVLFIIITIKNSNTDQLSVLSATKERSLPHPKTTTCSVFSGYLLAAMLMHG
jgi:hypothetical protein